MAEFVTNSSGDQATFDSGMVRDNATGKARYDLIEPLRMPLAETMRHRRALLMGRGAEHYGDRNWEKADGLVEFERFLASYERHARQHIAQLRARVYGYEESPEVMEEDHGAAVGFNLDGAEYVAWRLEQTPTVKDEELEDNDLTTIVNDHVSAYMRSVDEDIRTTLYGSGGFTDEGRQVVEPIEEPRYWYYNSTRLERCPDQARGGSCERDEWDGSRRTECRYDKDGNDVGLLP